MDKKIKELLNDFLKDKEFSTTEELNEAIDKFINDNNLNKLDNISQKKKLNQAYHLLETAKNSPSKIQAKQLAKDAYDKCPECFEAYLFYTQLEDEPLKQQQLLIKGLKLEQERLIKKGLFLKNNIGSFYQISETRSYIRGLYTLANLYVSDGKMRLAANICEEILNLNQSDNTDAHFLLMAIYAILEEEQLLLNLNQLYDYECLESLVPLMYLYYKKDNFLKSKEYLTKINEHNSYFKRYYLNEQIKDDNFLENFYQRGSMSEVAKYITNYDFLLKSSTTIKSFISKNGNI